MRERKSCPRSIRTSAGGLPIGPYGPSPSRDRAILSAARIASRDGWCGVTAAPVIAFVAQSMNQVTHGKTSSPSRSTSTGTCLRSPSQHALRHVGGRRRWTSLRRLARSPPDSAALCPGFRSLRTARCSVASDGTPATPRATSPSEPPAAPASASNSRCTAAAFPHHRARRAWSSGVIVKRARSRACVRPSSRAAASHRHTVRNDTPAPDATSRACSVRSSPWASSTSSRDTA